MTENEALKKHKEDCKRCRDKACTHGWDCLQKKDIEVYEELEQYRAIGTVEELQDLKEKNVAKKVISRGQGHEADIYCPNCNAFLGNDQDFCFSHTNYCNKCGQTLET